MAEEFRVQWMQFGKSSCADRHLIALDRVVFQNQVPEQVWHRLLKNHKVGSAVAAGLTSCCAMPFPLYNSGPEGDVYEDRHNIFKSPKYLSGPSAERNTEPCCENSNGT
jgi:hypothetical protein